MFTAVVISHYDVTRSVHRTTVSPLAKHDEQSKDFSNPFRVCHKHVSLYSSVPCSEASLMCLNISLLQILLVSDYFYAFLRREYYLTHGLHLTRQDGTEAMLVLK